MALKDHLTGLKNKGKYFVENTRYKIRQYQLTRGSGRTEQIFGMSMATKIMIALLLLVVVTAVFYGGKTLLNKEKSAGELTDEGYLPVEEADQEQAVAGEQAVPIEQEEVVQAESTPEPTPSAPALDEEKEQLRADVQRLQAENNELTTLLVSESALRDAVDLTILPEPFDVQNMGASCQVDIRDKEHDLESEIQFFKEANRSYSSVLEQVREPAHTLTTAIEQLRTKKQDLTSMVQKCVAEAPEQLAEPEPAPEPEPSPEPDPSSNSSENQTETSS
ncbi:MAG: hypothetical protein Q7R76_05470 [Candidatus Woesearchaeota archaeon]|nr:hypothetical protein [Candidatus Woesearchaeota archaeon]